MAPSKQFDAYVEGLNDVLRAFRALPKEASAELRKASQGIAERHMAPAWQNAALYNAGPWGQVIADSVKVRRDRVPAVQIGGNRKVLSGGGTATMVRYPSSSGEGKNSFAPFERTDWLTKTRAYAPAALQEWGRAVDEIVRKWETM
jgi:hypothetical protein